MVYPHTILVTHHAPSSHPAIEAEMRCQRANRVRRRVTGTGRTIAQPALPVALHLPAWRITYPTCQRPQLLGCRVIAADLVSEFRKSGELSERTTLELGQAQPISYHLEDTHVSEGVVRARIRYGLVCSGSATRVGSGTIEGMAIFLSEAQCAALEHLAAVGGTALIGKRPLTRSTVTSLQRQGLVRVNVPKIGAVTLSDTAKRDWMKSDGGSRETDLAYSVLILAELGGMPDSFWQTDARIALACSVLGITPTQARTWTEEHNEWTPQVA